MIVPSFVKKTAKAILPQRLLLKALDYYGLLTLPKKGLTVRIDGQCLEVCDSGDKCIRISRKHVIYLGDVINSFDYYYSAVEPIQVCGKQLVDYSTPRFHKVIGFDLFPVMFSSFAEPVVTTNQYLDFAGLKNGSVVLDLGAYSGLTSILFDRFVGPNGRVIAVDADDNNIQAIINNFGYYQIISGRKIELLEGAVWEHNKGIMFSVEGNMGASVIEYVGSERGHVRNVQTFTLNSIASRFDLKAVDFIKCDIEGAESVIFNAPDFFKKNKPRIVIEPHIVGGKLTVAACVEQLSPFGYSFQEIKQRGVQLPLLECCPL